MAFVRAHKFASRPPGVERAFIVDLSSPRHGTKLKLTLTSTDYFSAKNSCQFKGRRLVKPGI